MGKMSVSVSKQGSRVQPVGVAPQQHTIAVGGLAFDWVMMSLSLLFLGGLYLDGWAHNHGRVDDSFFTIWHAFF
jgi:hypothetical protein